VLIADPNLEFLSAIFVLLWPLGVVFPVIVSVTDTDRRVNMRSLLDNLAVFYDALDFVDHERADTH